MSRAAGRIATAEAFQGAFAVSRETLDRLRTYEALLKTWQRTINLVSPTTLDDIWHRHFADSAQLLGLGLEADIPPPLWGRLGGGDSATAHAGIPPTPNPSPHGGGELPAEKKCPADRSGGKFWLDIGSGGGFPGLVLAIMLAERDPLARMTLVESDSRKAAFLGEAGRKTGVAVEILVARSEKLATQAKSRIFDVITARAVAPLPKLLGLVQPFFSPQTVALIPKGREAEAEVAEARGQFAFDADLVPSLTDELARIVTIRNLAVKTEG